MPKLIKPRKHAVSTVETSARDRDTRTAHEKRRDHACTHCAAAFGKASHLTTHVRVVHEKRKGGGKVQGTKRATTRAKKSPMT